MDLEVIFVFIFLFAFTFEFNSLFNECIFYVFVLMGLHLFDLIKLVECGGLIE